MCSCRIVGFYSVLDKLPNDATYTMRSTRLTFGGMEYCGYTHSALKITNSKLKTTEKIFSPRPHEC